MYLAKITSLKDLLNEIVWSYDYPQYDFIKYSDGTYGLNKLYIEHSQVSYKTDRWELAAGVFEQFEKFYDLLQETERGSNVQ